MGTRLLVLLTVWASVAGAQAPAGNRTIGAVTAIDAGAKQLIIKTDAGAENKIALLDSTSYLRVPPGEKDLKNAAKISLDDIGLGDRILARGSLGDDKNSLVASSVIVMSQAELARKHEADRAEWQKRGVSGMVTGLNSDAKEITISSRGGQSLVIQVPDSADLKRYAPDSVRFSDAKPSEFADLKVGDQLRTLGTKNEDGSRLKAETVVSGSFRNVAATVVSVDAAGKSIRVNDLDTKKPLLVNISSDSSLRKLQPFAANMLAARINGAARGGGGAGGGDVEQMLERQPGLELAELKPGDALIIASTAGVDPNRITAITLLAGVEPILTSAPKGRQGMVLGNWNLDTGGGMGFPQ